MVTFDLVSLFGTLEKMAKATMGDWEQRSATTVQANTRDFYSLCFLPISFFPAKQE